MFTKQDIEKMLADNKGKTFFIKTNTANGHGLNGVSYDTIPSYRCDATILHVILSDVSYDRIEKCTIIKHKVLEVTDTMLVLEQESHYREFDSCMNVKRGKDYEYRDKTIRYIPIEIIQQIEFVEPDSPTYKGYERYYFDSSVDIVAELTENLKRINEG